MQKNLQGRDRLEQEAFLALQAHYLFKAEFCNVRAGNEKGRVEGTVGYVRRNAFVPLPEVQSMEELNNYLLNWCMEESERRKVPHRKETDLTNDGIKKKNIYTLFQPTNSKLVN
ncbi:MAG: hypothetical protein LRY71_00235 [Bacillaceae bacterium]|nr:hypothetical protein [Bacillaceae bacterium]